MKSNSQSTQYQMMKLRKKKSIKKIKKKLVNNQLKNKKNILFNPS
jgi:hypothetical protein